MNEGKSEQTELFYLATGELIRSAHTVAEYVEQHQARAHAAFITGCSTPYAQLGRIETVRSQFNQVLNSIVPYHSLVPHADQKAMKTAAQLAVVRAQDTLIYRLKEAARLGKEATDHATAASRMRTETTYHDPSTLLHADRGAAAIRHQFEGAVSSIEQLVANAQRARQQMADLAAEVTAR